MSTVDVMASIKSTADSEADKKYARQNSVSHSTSTPPHRVLFTPVAPETLSKKNCPKAKMF